MPPRFQSSHLGGANIKCVWTSAERSSTTTKLVVRLEKRDGQAFVSQQGCCSETGDAATDHDHVLD